MHLGTPLQLVREAILITRQATAGSCHEGVELLYGALL